MLTLVKIARVRMAVALSAEATLLSTHHGVDVVNTVRVLAEIVGKEPLSGGGLLLVENAHRL